MLPLPVSAPCTNWCKSPVSCSTGLISSDLTVCWIGRRCGHCDVMVIIELHIWESTIMLSLLHTSVSSHSQWHLSNMIHVKMTNYLKSQWTKRNQRSSNDTHQPADLLSVSVERCQFEIWMSLIRTYQSSRKPEICAHFRFGH